MLNITRLSHKHRVIIFSLIVTTIIVFGYLRSQTYIESEQRDIWYVDHVVGDVIIIYRGEGIVVINSSIPEWKRESLTIIGFSNVNITVPEEVLDIIQIGEVLQVFCMENRFSESRIEYIIWKLPEPAENYWSVEGWRIDEVEPRVKIVVERIVEI